jgi:SAM-dependent methyltransferase
MLFRAFKRTPKKLSSAEIAREIACGSFGANDIYTCPVCGYCGRFESVFPETGERKNAKCPKCSALERHRLQYLVLKAVSQGVATERMTMLHFAPEDFLRPIFKRMYGTYVTADLEQRNVDRNEDLTDLSFRDREFDIVYASHVLEYIKHDMKALSEIRRVLKPGGIAIVPVPIIGKKTVEYDEPNPHDSAGHIRCPGEDYYQKYEQFFAKLELYRSTDFDEKYQTHIFEDRSKWPRTMPLRPTMAGQKHIDVVPVGYK